jgi:Family of unknown function (DUF5343)
MADNPPFMNAYGLIPKILAKIREAKTPSRFTVDFLSTNLGFSGGSARPFMTSLNVLRGPIAHCCPLAEDEVARLRLALKDWFRLME